MRRASFVFPVLFSLVGCVGGIDGVGPGDDDEPPPPPPPPPQIISLKVVDGGVPIAGVAVVFQRSDDSLVADTVTDAQGVASADMPDGGNVTVIRVDPAGGPAQLYTYIGAKVGDQLEMGRPIHAGATPMSVNVLLPQALGNNATLRTQCGTATGGPTLPITLTGCPAEGGVFYATNGNQSFVKAAPMAPDIDFSLEATLENRTITMRTTNLPPNTTSTQEGYLSMGGYRMFATGPRNAANPQNVNYPDLPGVDQTTVIRVTMQESQQMISYHRKWINSTAVDVAPQLLPYVAAGTVDASGVTWTETPAGTPTPLSPDFVVARVDVTPAAGMPYVRSIVAPYAGTQLRFTQLPPAHGQYNATATDTVDATPALVKVPGLTGGYDAMRTTIFKHTDVLEAAPIDTCATMSYAGNTAPTF